MKQKQSREKFWGLLGLLSVSGHAISNHATPVDYMDDSNSS